MARFGNRNQDDTITEPDAPDDTSPEVEDTATVEAEARIAAALAASTDTPAPVDPWAFLATDGAIAEVAYVKAPPIETDIPQALRDLAEKALTAGTALRVTFPNAALVKPALKHFKAYAMCRVAGKIVIRAGVQRDGRTLHLTAKLPVVKPVEIAAPVEDSTL
jgi:hypothetical protein